jgi:hypothetical protein
MMSRAKTALVALAALAAAVPDAASLAVAAPTAAANCSRHIRVGVFDDANPLAAAFLTGWMDNAATACYSFHHMSTGNRAIELGNYNRRAPRRNNAALHGVWRRRQVRGLHEKGRAGRPRPALARNRLERPSERLSALR